MSTASRIVVLLALALCCWIPLYGGAPLVVTAASAGERIRFVAPAGGAQIRVQIVAPSGDTLFDSSWNDGNVFDWPFLTSGSPLASGSYGCVVMAKDLEGEITEKHGSVTVRGSDVSVRFPEGSDGPASPKITILAHDGRAAALVSTAGDLSFRFGDFLAGGDSEAMRLTADGELRVKSLVFWDGTRLATADDTVRSGNNLIISRPPGVAPVIGSVPKSRPKLKPAPAVFPPAYQFVVGDTGVNVGTTNPAYKLDVNGPVDTSTHYTIGGVRALFIDAGGNAIAGYFAGTSNNGGSNSFFGTQAGEVNSTGSGNSFFGYQSGASNTTGMNNAFFGKFSGVFSTGGNDSFFGEGAGFNTTTGNDNTGLGRNALFNNTTGNGNIAIGTGAGQSLTTGHNNIDIGHIGNAGEAATIRIGTSTVQTRAFIAGIRGVTTAGSAIPVLIDSAGQLGTASSSRRVKLDIEEMGGITDGLMDLRPVTFRYLARGADAPLQYGLIAEEVAEIYPEMVARNAEGEVDTVMYQFLAPMLLNEVQRQHRKIEEQQKTIEALERRLEALEHRRR